MSETKEKIQIIFEPILQRRGAYLVDVQLRSERGRRVVQVLVDTDAGIQIEECAQISRELSPELDALQVVQGSYQLEVSSPGIDKPLRLLRQYRKNVGRRFHVNYHEMDLRRELKATLVSVQDDQLSFLSDEGETVTLPFSQIIESKEVLPW